MKKVPVLGERSVYSGREFLGRAVQRQSHKIAAPKWHAIDAEGRELGPFPTWVAAVSALAKANGHPHERKD